MAKFEIKDYTDFLDNDLLAADSILKDENFDFIESLGFDQTYEGVPLTNLIVKGEVKSLDTANRRNTGWRIGSDNVMEVGSIFYNKHYFHTAFESRDPWTESIGAGGSISATFLNHIMATGATSGTTVSARSIGSPVILDFTKNPTIISQFKILTTASMEAFVIAGRHLSTSQAFGFRVLNGTLQAYHRDAASVETTTAIPSNPNMANLQNVRATFNSSLNQIEFYVNGILEVIHNTNLPTNTTDVIAMLSITTNSAADKQLHTSFITFYQDK